MAPLDPVRTLLAQAERVAGTGSWLWDPANDRVVWSEGFRALLGVPVDAPPGAELFFARVHPEDRPHCEQVWQEVPRTGEIRALEYRIVRPDGGVRWVRSQSTRLEDGTFVGTLVDVTDLRRADAAVTDARALLEESQSVAGMGTFAYFPGTRTRIWSDGLYRLLGLEPGTPIGEAYERFLPADERERVLAWANELRHREQVPPLRHRVVRADGEIRRVEVHARRTQAGADRSPCVIGVAIDVTEQAALEERLAEAEKNRAIGALALGLAHDLGNWLTVMRHQTEQLPAGDPIRTEMERALGSCVALTRELLSVAHRRPAEARLVEVRTQVEAAAPILRRAVGSRVQVEVELGPEAGWALIDPAHLESVLLNLAVNARDAMPQGGRFRLTVSTEPSGEGGQVVVRAEDTGVGIPEEHLARVFEPYFTTKDDRGHGLGLASVQGTVRQHGGEVTVESRVGVGTTFTIRLPRHPGPQVLVVDDLPEMRSVVARTLARAGIRAVEAADGAEALGVLERERCALVVTDWLMPGMNGEALVRALEARGGPPVVIVTGQLDHLEDERIPVVRKPFRPKELLEPVLRALTR